MRSCNHDTGGGGSSAVSGVDGILHLTGHERITDERGNGGNGGDRGPDNDDSSAGENDGTREPSARLGRPARVVFVHTTDRCTTGPGGAAGTHPDTHPAPEGATGLAGANLHIH
ncbi:hypothetical protein OV079_05055 [Nannocystis pusilla]|uniref:Uncharacterized protein n=1 Tax=Nannocystis pusilla TaxID=889268 RepID=A0A9X3IWM8_9BACT|nr:hypothetical protein [Nannocystis pusilla]MCY1004948.1 hypothetical protein [Nannocystis pusilla]